MIKQIVMFLLIFQMCGVACAAFTLDTSAESSNSSADPITLSLTCGANSKLLVLAIGSGTVTSRTGGSPTYNGVTMIRVGNEVIAGSGVEVTSELWYLSNPTTGSAVNISVPNSGSKNIKLSASSFNSTVAIGAGLESFTSTNVTAANPSLTITPATDGTVIVDSFADGNSGAPSNSQTLLFSNGNGGWDNGSQYALQATKAAITFSWTIASDDVAFIVAVFKEAVGTVIKDGSLIRDTSVIKGQ